MKYHVHVYKVVGKIEKDVTADTPEEAQERAIFLVKNSPSVWGESECTMIAIEFKEGEKE